MTEYSVVITTTGSEEDARKLARGLVEARLAACVNIIPKVISIYNWKGRTEQESEYLLYAKTKSSLIAGVQTFLTEHHPYELPECIALPIVDGSQGYLDWMGNWLSDEAK